MIDLALVDGDERREVELRGIPWSVFEDLVQQWVRGTFPSPMVQRTVHPLEPGDIATVPAAGTWEGDALRDAGLQWITAGRVAVLLLNGGMATRFGGRVKGTVDVLPGRSFLALQAARLRALSARTGATIPWVLMNSVATAAVTDEHLIQQSYFGLPTEDVFQFEQSVLPRIHPDGRFHRDASGRLSWYGPGHGDVLVGLLRSGVADRLRARGVQTLLVANVDNLGASVDPSLLGRFLASGRDLMVEVAPKSPGDVGGAPARVDGRPVLVEGFAFPSSFDQGQIRVFNTNTLWIRLEALTEEPPLRWYAVTKEDAGQPVVQFERLVGQWSWFVPSLFVGVSRDRFLPVKAPEDLEAIRPILREQFGHNLRVLGTGADLASRRGSR